MAVIKVLASFMVSLEGLTGEGFTSKLNLEASVFAGS